MAPASASGMSWFVASSSPAQPQLGRIVLKRCADYNVSGVGRLLWMWGVVSKQWRVWHHATVVQCGNAGPIFERIETMGCRRHHICESVNNMCDFLTLHAQPWKLSPGFPVEVLWPCAFVHACEWYQALGCKLCHGISAFRKKHTDTDVVEHVQQTLLSLYNEGRGRKAGYSVYAVAKGLEVLRRRHYLP